MSNGRVAWELVNPATNSATLLLSDAATHTMPAGEWSHLACFWTATLGVRKMYVNGLLAASGQHGATTLGNGTAILKVGQTAISSIELDGGVSQGLIFDRALTDAEVSALSGGL